jgi:hypothetical protein
MKEFLGQVVEYYNKIHDIPALYALIIAALLPFVIIAVGYLIQLIGEALASGLSIMFAPQVASGLVNYVFFPGVVLHEMAHAFLAVITGAKITEVALFKHVDDSLGHVNFRNRGNIIVVALQNIFISSAPMFIGAVVVWGCFYWIHALGHTLLWLRILLGYIGVSMFFHMTMSPADIKVYVKGIPLFIVIVFVVVFPLRYFGVL